VFAELHAPNICFVLSPAGESLTAAVATPAARTATRPRLPPADPTAQRRTVAAG